MLVAEQTISTSDYVGYRALSVDEFAAYAMVGILIARAGIKGTIIDEEEIASDAYAIARAMKKEKEKC